MLKDTPVVILCGGEGTRLRELTELIPKPLVEIGGRPILLHIMQQYARHGYHNFILALGYKGEMIKDYFINHRWKAHDIELDLASGQLRHLDSGPEMAFNIKFVDTGAKTNTGGRIKRLEKYITTDNFLATYGDGLSSVNIEQLVNFHMQKGRIATLTGITPFTNFGVLRFTREDLIDMFEEKPQITSWINGGFFVFKRDIFKHMGPNDVLEQDTLPKLAALKELVIHRHEGFWKCMDTYKDYLSLNELWSKGNPPWLV